jgi:hypothetical protein
MKKNLDNVIGDLKKAAMVNRGTTGFKKKSGNGPNKGRTSITDKGHSGMSTGY